MPAYRIYTVDGDYAGSTWVCVRFYYRFQYNSQQAIEADTYFLDLDKTNIPGATPVWQHEYTTTVHFSLCTFA